MDNGMLELKQNLELGGEGIIVNGVCSLLLGVYLLWVQNVFDKLCIVPICLLQIFQIIL